MSGLCRFLHEVHYLARAIVWSSMMLENTEPTVSFLFHVLAPLCLILGQKFCDELLDKRGASIMKVGWGGRTSK